MCCAQYDEFVNRAERPDYEYELKLEDARAHAAGAASWKQLMVAEVREAADVLQKATEAKAMAAAHVIALDLEDRNLWVSMIISLYGLHLVSASL